MPTTETLFKKTAQYACNLGGLCDPISGVTLSCLKDVLNDMQKSPTNSNESKDIEATKALLDELVARVGNLEQDKLQSAIRTIHESEAEISIGRLYQDIMCSDNPQEKSVHHYNIGFLYENSNKKSQAIESYINSLTCDPANVRPLKILHTYYLNNHKLSEAQTLTLNAMESLRQDKHRPEYRLILFIIQTLQIKELTYSNNPSKAKEGLPSLYDTTSEIVQSSKLSVDWAHAIIEFNEVALVATSTFEAISNKSNISERDIPKLGAYWKAIVAASIFARSTYDDMMVITKFFRTGLDSTVVASFLTQCLTSLSQFFMSGVSITKAINNTSESGTVSDALKGLELIYTQHFVPIHSAAQKLVGICNNPTLSMNFYNASISTLIEIASLRTMFPTFLNNIDTDQQLNSNRQKADIISQSLDARSQLRLMMLQCKYWSTIGNDEEVFKIVRKLKQFSPVTYRQDPLITTILNLALEYSRAVGNNQEVIKIENLMTLYSQ